MHQLCTRLNCVTSHYPYHKSVSAPRLPQEFASWGTQSLKGKGRRSLRVCHVVWCIMMYYDISSGSLMSLTYEQTDSWPDILSKKKGPMSNLYHHLQHGNTPKTSVGEGSYSTPLLTINLLCKHVYLSKFRVGGTLLHHIRYVDVDVCFAQGAEAERNIPACPLGEFSRQKQIVLRLRKCTVMNDAARSLSWELLPPKLHTVLMRLSGVFARFGNALFHPIPAPRLIVSATRIHYLP